MRIKLAISCGVIALLSVVFSQTSAAQVNVQVQIGPPPPVRFETAPVLVEVSPGVQVVPDYDQEVFFVDGWYWYHSGPTWYRTRDHRGGWVVVHRREVPRGLVHIPPGRYRHYRAEGPHFNEHRREIPPGHRGEGHFKHEERREFKEHNDRNRSDRNNQNARPEPRERKEHGEQHHGHR